MSQTTEPVSVVSLAKGLDATRRFDPDETMQVPIAALVAGDIPRQAPAPTPPLLSQEERLRAATKRAYAAAAQLWDGPMPDYIHVHQALPYGGADVEAYLRNDVGLVRMAQFVERYGVEGEMKHSDHPRPYGPPAKYSQYSFRLDGVRIVVWTLNEPAMAA